MFGSEFVVLAFACCSWLGSAAEALLVQPQAVTEAALQPMKGRAVAVEIGPEYSEAGMHDPADRIAGSLATSLASRYGLQFEPGRAPGPDMLVLAMHTREWTVEPGWSDYYLRYRGEATLVDRKSGRRLGRAWCDQRALTGKNSYDAAIKDRRALALSLQAAADSCLRQLRESLLAEAAPR